VPNPLATPEIPENSAERKIRVNCVYDRVREIMECHHGLKKLQSYCPSGWNVTDRAKKKEPRDCQRQGLKISN